MSGVIKGPQAEIIENKRKRPSDASKWIADAQRFPVETEAPKSSTLRIRQKGWQ